MGRLIRVLTISEKPPLKRGKDLEGGCGQINRVSVVTARAGVGDDDVGGFAVPGNPDLLATVRGLGTGVTVDTRVEGSDEVVVSVLFATGTIVTILGVVGKTETGMRKWSAADAKHVLTLHRCESRKSGKARVPGRRTLWDWGWECESV